MANTQLSPTKVQQFINNIQAINELALDVPNMDVLNAYKGFGGLKRCFWDKTLYGQLMRGIRANFGREKEHEVLESLRNSSSSAYYTPKEVINFIYKYIGKVCNFTGGDILEPSCGNGAFFKYMPENIKANSNVTAVEYDSLTAKLVSKMYPTINVINDGLQNIDFENKKYDLIIGNPPYSAEKINDDFMPDISGYSIHHYFIAKCVRLLKDDGILAFVMPSFFMDIPHGHTRHIIDNEAVLIDAVRLPDNLFANATVTVDLIFIRKTGNKLHNIVDTAKLQQANATDSINQFWIDNPNRILGELKLKYVECYKRYVPTCQTASKEQALKFLEVCSFTEETMQNFKDVVANNKDKGQKINNDKFQLIMEMEQMRIELINLTKKFADLHNKAYEVLAA